MRACGCLATHLACPLAKLAPTWPNLGELERSWAELGAYLSQLGASLRRLGTNLGQLKSTWSILGPFFHKIEQTCDQLEPTWGYLGHGNPEKSVFYIPFAFIPYPLSQFPGPAECAERLNTASPCCSRVGTQSRNLPKSDPYLLPRSEVYGHRAFRQA